MSKEIKPGYKMTKLGWIPEEWRVLKLGDLMEEYSSGANIKSSDFIDSAEKSDKILVLPKSGVCYGGFIKIENEKRQYIENLLAFSKYKNSFINKGEYAVVLRDLVPSGPNIGLIGKVNKEDAMLMAQGVYSLKWNNQVLGDLMSIISNCLWYRRTMQKTLVGSTQVHIGLKDFFKVLIPLPPLPEQKKIADILSTWDKAIETTQSLIEKLQLRKKGLMQQLLSGKKRLPGFSGEWEVTSLKNILTIGSGKDYKHLKEGNIPVYGTGGLMLHVDEFLYDGESVGIGRKGTINKPIYLKGKFWTVDTLFYTHSFTNSIVKFVYYLFLKINWLRYNEASGVPSLSKKTIEQIKVNIPELQEQTAIAQILSNADDEIDRVQEYLEQLQEQKKGLMQQLLTGQRRVVV